MPGESRKEWAPVVVAVCGPPGVGKSTVAERVADAREAEVFRTDAIRDAMIDNPTYSPGERATVYAAMIRRAERAVRTGEDVVLDATFQRSKHRDAARRMAERVGARFIFIHITCDEETVRERIRNRDDDVSDADFDVFQEVRNQFDPVDRADIVVDNTRPLPEMEDSLPDCLVSKQRIPE